MKRHLFFDLDGTLTDPREGIVRSLQHAFATLGVDVPREADLERMIGPPLAESLRRVLGTAREHLVPDALASYRERYRNIGMFENRVYAGISEALIALRASGWTLWVVTSKPTVVARAILDHFSLTEHFDAVHGSELSGERADKRDLIAHVLRTERMSPSTVVMIGDRSHDVIGARANGLRSVAVLWGYGSRHELVESGADVLFESVAELVSSLASERPGVVSATTP